MSPLAHPDRLFNRRALKRLGAGLLLFMALSAPLVDMHFVNLLMPESQSDFVPVRIGTLVALQRGDPYSESTARRIQLFYYGRPLAESDRVIPMAFAYPVSAAIVLAPFAFLPWNAFRVLFLVAIPTLLAMCVPLWLRTLHLRVGTLRAAILAALLLASWPAMWALRLQQVTLIVLILLTAGCFFLKRGWDAGAAIAMTLSTVKPQLVFPLIAWLLLWTVLKRRWRFPLSFAACSGSLLLGSLWLVPGWIPHWYRAMAQYSQYTGVRPLLQTLLGRWIGLALMLAAAGATTRALWRIRECDQESIDFGWAIALTLAATELLNPRSFPMLYNQLLLLPACLMLLHRPPTDTNARLARNLAIVWMQFGFSATVIAALGELSGYGSAFCLMLPFQNSLLSVVVFLAILVSRADSGPYSSTGTVLHAG